MRPAATATSAPDRFAARAVDDQRVAEEEIDHAVFSIGVANSASISRRIR
jgi:hypothetical protein